MNYKHQRAFCLLLALCFTCLFTASCSSTKKKQQPISATILNENYRFGTYSAEFNATLFQLDKAVRRACARARLTKADHAYRTSSCDYEFIDVDKIPVSITIAQQEEGTKIKIRVDSFGDEDSSRKLVVAIDEELKIITQGPAAQNPAAPVAP